MADVDFIETSNPVLYRSNLPIEAGDFIDARVVLLPAGPHNMRTLGSYTPEALESWQKCDGPTELYIGKEVSTERLQRAAKRLGVDPVALIEFRDGL